MGTRQPGCSSLEDFSFVQVQTTKLGLNCIEAKHTITHLSFVQQPALMECRNATLRSKAETKARTFLWFYGKRVLAQSCTSGFVNFDESQREYQTFAGSDSMTSAIVSDSELANLRVGGSPSLSIVAPIASSGGVAGALVSHARPVRAVIIHGRSRSCATAGTGSISAAVLPSRRQQPRATRKQRSWESEFDSEDDSAAEDDNAHYSEAGDDEAYADPGPSSHPATLIKQESTTHGNSQVGICTARRVSSGPQSSTLPPPSSATLNLSAAPQHPRLLADMTEGNVYRGKKVKREPGAPLDNVPLPMAPPPARQSQHHHLSSPPLSHFKSYFAGGGDAAVTVQLGSSKQQGLASKLGPSETERAMWCAASPALSMMRTPLSMCKSGGRGSDMSDLDAGEAAFYRWW